MERRLIKDLRDSVLLLEGAIGTISTQHFYKEMKETMEEVLRRAQTYLDANTEKSPANLNQSSPNGSQNHPIYCVTTGECERLDRIRLERLGDVAKTRAADYTIILRENVYVMSYRNGQDIGEAYIHTVNLQLAVSIKTKWEKMLKMGCKIKVV